MPRAASSSVESAGSFERGRKPMTALRYYAQGSKCVLGVGAERHSDQTLTFRLPLDDRMRLLCVEVRYRHNAMALLA